MNSIEEIQKDQLKKIPKIRIGDTLKVTLKIVEGERERLQSFTGTLIARKGKGLTETITLRRISYGEGVERVLPIHSPRIDRIEIMQQGKVRQAKLYYLRGRVGRHARIRDIRREIEVEEETLKTQEATSKEPEKKEPEKPEEKTPQAETQIDKVENKEETKETKEKK